MTIEQEDMFPELIPKKNEVVLQPINDADLPAGVVGKIPVEERPDADSEEYCPQCEIGGTGSCPKHG